MLYYNAVWCFGVCSIYGRLCIAKNILCRGSIVDGCLVFRAKDRLHDVSVKFQCSLIICDYCSMDHPYYGYNWSVATDKGVCYVVILAITVSSAAAVGLDIKWHMTNL